MRGHRITYKKNIKVAKMLQIERHLIKDIMKWPYVHNEIGSYLPTCEYNKYQRLVFKSVELYCFW